MWKKISGLLVSFTFTSLLWAQTLDLNSATEVQLDGLKGVGPVLTKQVLAERQKSPFKDWADATQRIKGLGPQKASSLSSQGLRVQGKGYTAPAKAPTKTGDSSAKPAKPSSSDSKR